MPALSIVMPAYNEGAHIEAAVDDWLREVAPVVPDLELVVVDDCSTDDTAERLARMATGAPHLRVLRTSVNGGHGRAVRLGLSESRGTYVFQTDSDRQHLPSDFWQLWNLRHQADFVLGVREQRADGGLRLLISSVLRFANAVTWGYVIPDANCPFKLMERSAMLAVLEQIPPDSFIPMVMVSVLARYRGYRVLEAPVHHLPRVAGQQSLRGLTRWMRVGAICTAQLVALRWSARGGTRVAKMDGAR